MPGPRPNVVLVEDDEIDIINFQRACKKNQLDLDLHLAADGIEGLELLRGNRLPRERRLVLLDLNLPRMSGLEMLRELRSDPALRSIPVVVLTTSGEERDLRAAYDLNAAGYLIKPSVSSEFVDLVAALARYWSLTELL
jgi:CheY-like chemotaxis protein